jgi:hypothetical protein
MVRCAAGLVRRVIGAGLLLLLLVCGAEVFLRLSELRASRRLVPQHRPSSLESITVPSWLIHQELKPLASVQVTQAKTATSHVLRVNSFGVRGPEVDVPKPPDVYRVLCLGDEQILAAHLSEEDHLCATLQRQLQQQTRLRVEVLNCGAPGGCPLTEFLLLTHRLAPLQPDLVVVAVQENDLGDDLAYRRCTRNDRSGTPLACRHPSLGRMPKADSLTAWRQEFRLIDVGLRFAGDAWKRKTESRSALDDNGAAVDLSRLRHDRTAIERTLQPLAPLAAWCRNSSVALCVCEIRPAGSQAGSSESSFTAAAKELAAAHNFPFVNLAQISIPSEPGIGRARSAADHREIALQLGTHLIAETPGPWSSPYFRSERNAVLPVSHESGRGARFMIREDSAQRR